MIEADGIRLANTKYAADLSEAVKELGTAACGDLQDQIVAVMSEGGTLWIVGNGGSGANAAHIAFDLTRAASLSGLPGKAVAPLDRVVSTAMFNDNGDRMFGRLAQFYSGPRDAWLALSVSGRSTNILSILTHGRAIGALVFALCGQAGDISKTADTSVILGKGDYGIAEDLQLAFCHSLVRQMLGGEQTVCQSRERA